QALISNAMILSFKPGLDLIKKFNGLHNFTKWDGIQFTDSGGFQMSSPSLFISIDDKAVQFRNPFTKQRMTLTPEKCMEIQIDLGSDVAMCLDHMPHPVTDSKQFISNATRRTSLWAERCKKHHDELKKKTKSNQLLFGITQGGLDKNLRKQSCLDLNKINFDGFAIGGLGMGETKKQAYSVVDYSEKFLDAKKPRYLMGIGDPLDILEAVSHGIDCLDSKFPTQNARHAVIFTKKGNIKLDKGPFAEDKRPLDESCNCKVCKTYSRAFLRHLWKLNEYTVNHYLSYHNIYFIQNMLKEIREAIKKKTFNSYKKNFLKNYKVKDLKE
ncbi:MAG: tRNA guanosine(34) transglycosylase Tgt, partial [Nanoarchaeota archaeon]